MYRQYCIYTIAREFAPKRLNIAGSEVLANTSCLVIFNNRKRKRKAWIRPYLNKRETPPNLIKELTLDDYLTFLELAEDRDL